MGWEKDRAVKAREGEAITGVRPAGRSLMRTKTRLNLMVEKGSVGYESSGSAGEKGPDRKRGSDSNPRYLQCLIPRRNPFQKEREM